MRSSLLARCCLLARSSVLARCSLFAWCSLLAWGSLLTRRSLLAWCCLLARRSLFAWCSLFAWRSLFAWCGLLTRCSLLTRRRLGVSGWTLCALPVCLPGLGIRLCIGMLCRNTPRTLRTGIVLRPCGRLAGRRSLVGRGAGMSRSRLIRCAGLTGRHHAVTAQLAGLRRCSDCRPAVVHRRQLRMVAGGSLHMLRLYSRGLLVLFMRYGLLRLRRAR